MISSISTMNENQLTKIVEKAFSNQKLLTSNSTISIENHTDENVWNVDFISEEKFYCRFAINTSNLVGCNWDYSSWPKKRRGIGRKMVQATEEVYENTGIQIALVLEAAAEIFWEEMNYTPIDKNIKEKEKRIIQYIKPYQVVPKYKVIEKNYFSK